MFCIAEIDMAIDMDCAVLAKDASAGLSNSADVRGAHLSTED